MLYLPMTGAVRPCRLATFVFFGMCVIAGFAREGMGQTALPQSPPAHPRLLLNGQSIATLQGKIAAGGVSAWAWSRMSYGAAFDCGACPPVGASNHVGYQASWRVYRSMRYMLEAAARWQVEGNVSARNSARALLLGNACGSGPANSAVTWLTPAGSSSPWIAHTHIGAMAATFDLLYDELTLCERQAVVTRLLQWVNAFYAGAAGPGPFYIYGSAADNHSFAWHAGIVMALLAVWGEPSVHRPGIVAEIDHLMQGISKGWLDVVSPDGSYDEGTGYAQYGAQSALRAAISARNCGFPDYAAGTNIEKMPKWFGRMVMGSTYPWLGDASPSHRGVDFDPILFWKVSELQDAEGKWCLDRVRAAREVSVNTTTHSYSPWLSMALYYPDALTASRPTVLSALFRDNLNEVPPGTSPSYNKTHNFIGLGDGALALLHNSPDDSWSPLAVTYMIRDEWMNHAHEDDGHVGITVDGVHLLVDQGYAHNFIRGQSTEHNIVTVGNVDFNGYGSNIFTVPQPDGRFHGTLKGRLLSPQLDYVRGDHRFMWMMERADRSVIMIKDPNHPYVIHLDEVRKTGGTHTYQQRWNTASAMSGSGTVASPYTIAHAGKNLRAVYLEPNQRNKVTGGSGSASGISWSAERIESVGHGDHSMLSIWSSTPLTSATPLPLPSANLKGGILEVPGGHFDKVMSSLDDLPTQDAETSMDGTFAWIRTSATGVITEYAVTEAQQLDHQGSNLLQSTEKVSLSVHGGAAWITRAVGTDPAAVAWPDVHFWAPSTITEVFVNGDSAPFISVGGVIQVGISAPTTLPPPPSTEDRFYSFTSNALFDGVVEGSVTFGSTGSIMASPGASATFYPHNKTPFDAQPIYIAVDVESLLNSTERLGLLRITDASEQESHLHVGIYGEPSGGLLLAVEDEPESTTVVSIQGFDPNSQRIGLLYDPIAGSWSILDRIGQVMATGTCRELGSPILVALELSSSASFDNFAVYDSAENGVDPQGVCVWGFSDGRLGFAWQSCTALVNPQVSMSIGGWQVPFGVMGEWLGSSFDELVLVQAIAPVPALPASAREFALESRTSVIPTLPGVSWVFQVSTAGHQPMSGGMWYQ